MITIDMPYTFKNTAELNITNISLSYDMITELHNFLNDMHGNWLYSIERFLYRIKDDKMVPPLKLEQYFLNLQKALDQIAILKEWGVGIAEKEIGFISTVDYLSLCNAFHKLRETIVYDRYSLYALSGENIGQHRVSIALANGKMFAWLEKFREEFFTPMANEIKMNVREGKDRK